MNFTILVVLTAVAVATGKPVTESTAISTTSIGDDRRDLSSDPPSDLADDDHLLPEADDDVMDILDEFPDEELGDEEAMEGAEAVVFRPLFAHRQREERRRRARAYRNHYGHGSHQLYRPFRPFRLRPVYRRPIRDEQPPLQILY